MDVDIQTQDNGATLGLASEQGHTEVVKLLSAASSERSGVYMRADNYSLALEKAMIKNTKTSLRNCETGRTNRFHESAFS